jgi:hypothetical protein
MESIFVVSLLLDEFSIEPIFIIPLSNELNSLLGGTYEALVRKYIVFPCGIRCALSGLAKFQSGCCMLLVHEDSDPLPPGNEPLSVEESLNSSFRGPNWVEFMISSEFGCY